MKQDRNTYFVVAVALLGCVVAACNPQRAVTLDDLLHAEDMEQFNMYAARAKSKGIDGIPLLLAVIDDSLETKYNVFSYGKLNTSIVHLHDLAADGIYTLESVPILIQAIEEQTAIVDTLVTAETLQAITGVDSGYDAGFVSSYRVEDEERREEMISQWREWYVDNSSATE
jgi:hypothetical protein